MAPEDRQEGLGLVVGLALDGHLPVGMMEEGEHVQGSVTDVLELLEAFAHPRAETGIVQFPSAALPKKVQGF